MIRIVVMTFTEYFLCSQNYLNTSCTWFCLVLTTALGSIRDRKIKWLSTPEVTAGCQASQCYFRYPRHAQRSLSVHCSWVILLTDNPFMLKSTAFKLLRTLILLSRICFSRLTGKSKDFFHILELWSISIWNHVTQIGNKYIIRLYIKEKSTLTVLL